MKRNIFIGALVLILIGVIFYLLVEKGQREISEISSFEECAAAGYPIMESYPEQCRTPDGRNFVRNINEVLIPPVACTMDAKICPDGSAVGRTGPNCEFAPCPQ